MFSVIFIVLQTYAKSYWFKIKGCHIISDIARTRVGHPFWLPLKLALFLLYREVFPVYFIIKIFHVNQGTLCKTKKVKITVFSDILW